VMRRGRDTSARWRDRRPHRLRCRLHRRGRAPRGRDRRAHGGPGREHRHDHHRHRRGRGAHGGIARGTGAPSASTGASGNELGRMRTAAGDTRSDPDDTASGTGVPRGVTDDIARSADRSDRSAGRVGAGTGWPFEPARPIERGTGETSTATGLSATSATASSGLTDRSEVSAADVNRPRAWAEIGWGAASVEASERPAHGVPDRPRAGTYCGPVRASLVRCPNRMYTPPTRGSQTQGS
jgi:hypothetical protein